MTRRLTRLVRATACLAVVAAAATPLVGPAAAADGSGKGAGTSNASSAKADACRPSAVVLRAEDLPVPGLSAQQRKNAVAIINAAADLGVPSQGQKLAVMTALQASDLTNRTGAEAAATNDLGLFAEGTLDAPAPDRVDPVAAAQHFYRGLLQVPDWESLTPTLAAHAVQHNLDPQAYARYWDEAVTIVDRLTSGTGVAGLQNLAAQAQRVATCEAATLKGQFASASTPYVGPLSPAALAARTGQISTNGGAGWYRMCQAFVAVLDGRAYSGYATALDGWLTFVAQGVAHPVTGPDGVTPPPGAWLYYASSSSAAGHVATYLGNGQVASTDVFGVGRAGIGPASALTDGPWHLQYLGWAVPWGGQ